MLDEVGAHERIDVDSVTVLAREHDRGHELGLAVAVADRHLALRVGPQVGHDVAPAHFGRSVDQTMGQMDGQRHQDVGVPACVPEHHALIAGALLIELVVVGWLDAHLERLVDPLGDVGRLLVDGGDDAARLVVEAVLGPGVADLGDGLAHHRRDVDVGMGRDLARDDHQPGGDQRLAGHPSVRVVSQDGVKHRVRDLVGDLVRMAFADRFGREQVLMVLHG